MEKLITELGCGITFVFFILGFCLTNSWLLGCIPGIVLSGLGLMFGEE